MKNNQKGITLIALIITIIVMLILVGVSVNIALNNGLFKATQNAATQTKEAVKQENALSSGQVTVGDVTYSSIDDYLEGLNGYEYEITIGGVRTGIGFNENWTWEQLASKNSNVLVQYVDNVRDDIYIKANGSNKLLYTAYTSLYSPTDEEYWGPAYRYKGDWERDDKCVKQYIDAYNASGNGGLYFGKNGGTVSYVKVSE